MTQPVRLRVVAVIEETSEAKSFRLQASERLAYQPGQFLTVGVPSERGMVARCYSLSSAPHEDEFTITVKRTRDGYGSNWMCDRLERGSTLTVLPPSGTFVPRSFDTGLLLFAAGSGITPVISIAKSALAQSTCDVNLFYANRDPASVIFADQLRDLSRRHPDRFHVVHWLEALQSLPTVTDLKRFASAYPDYSAYSCGPAPFMDAVGEALGSLGFPKDRCKREVFTSLSGNPFEAVEHVSDPGASVTHVRGTHNGQSFEFDDWPADQPLLQFLLSKGIAAPFSCRNGECSACCFRLLSGTVEMARNDVLDDDELADGYRLACQAKPTSSAVIITYD